MRDSDPMNVIYLLSVKLINICLVYMLSEWRPSLSWSTSSCGCLSSPFGKPNGGFIFFSMCVFSLSFEGTVLWKEKLVLTWFHSSLSAPLNCVAWAKWLCIFPPWISGLVGVAHLNLAAAHPLPGRYHTPITPALTDRLIKEKGGNTCTPGALSMSYGEV